MSAPDAAIRNSIDAIPAFQTNGVFDKDKFTQVLAQNNIAPDDFIREAKENIAEPAVDCRRAERCGRRPASW